MKLKIHWLGARYFTRPFISNGGFKSRWIYYFEIVRYKNIYEKKFGRWEVWLQDDIVRFFSFFPFVIVWGNMPDRKFSNI